MIKAVISDLDETLISARPAHEGALKAALENYGYNTEIEWIYGLTSVDLLKYNFPKMPEEDVKKIAEMKKKKLSNYLRLVKKIPGSEDFLEFIKKSNLKLCLLTNNTHHEIEILLENLGWKQYFDCIVGMEDGSPKPSPEPILIALQRLNLGKEDVLYFGDSDSDIESAHTANVLMMLTQIIHNTAKETKKASFVITNYNEAMSKIKELIE